MNTSSDRLDPQRQFVGCLLHLPVGSARYLLAGMRTDDLSNTMAARVLHLIIEVLAQDQPSTPMTLFAYATTTKRVTSAYQIERLALWLIETYHDAPAVPEITGTYLKTVVLEHAWRRALREHAHRMLQAVATSPTDVLYQVSENTDRIVDLWQRYRATCIDKSNRAGASA